MILIKCTNDIEVIELPDNQTKQNLLFKKHPIVKRNDEEKEVEFVLTAYNSETDANATPGGDGLNGKEVSISDLLGKNAKRRMERGRNAKPKIHLKVNYDELTSESNIDKENDLIIKGLSEELSLALVDFVIL